MRNMVYLDSGSPKGLARTRNGRETRRFDIAVDGFPVRLFKAYPVSLAITSRSLDPARRRRFRSTACLT
jgi:hypothetical protein